MWIMHVPVCNCQQLPTTIRFRSTGDYSVYYNEIAIFITLSTSFRQALITWQTMFVWTWIIKIWERNLMSSSPRIFILNFDIKVKCRSSQMSGNEILKRVKWGTALKPSMAAALHHFKDLQWMGSFFRDSLFSQPSWSSHSINIFQKRYSVLSDFFMYKVWREGPLARQGLATAALINHFSPA